LFSSPGEGSPVVRIAFLEAWSDLSSGDLSSLHGKGQIWSQIDMDPILDQRIFEWFQPSPSTTLFLSFLISKMGW
jgi:hypothetical protein